MGSHCFIDNSAERQSTMAGVNLLRERAKDEKEKGLQLNLPESLPFNHLVGRITGPGRVAIGQQRGEAPGEGGVSVSNATETR